MNLPNKPLTLSYTFLSVFDVGVLIEGPSGSGKSDTCLALVQSGHKLISDDSVTLYKKDCRLWGERPEMNEGEVFLLGLGIVNFKQVFSDACLLKQHPVDLKINLMAKKTSLEVDQFQHELILGEKITSLELPFSDQRNLSILIETAAKCFLLRKKGYNAAIEFNKRQRAMIDESKR